jgi:phage shock protein PspC (stress-responsive transcriptional regulator)
MADPRRLVRDPNDQVVAGVCAAAGRYTGTDPVLWRVAVAVLALFGGAGLALYVIGWLMVPKAGEPQSVAERFLHKQDRSVTVLGVIGAVILAVVLLALLDNGPGAGALLVLGGIAYLVARDRREAVAAPAATPPASTSMPGTPPPGAWVPPPTATTFGSGTPPPGAAAAPPVRKERSPLGRLTLSLVVVVVGVLLALRESGVEELTAPRILAGVLLVLGAGLLVGTWRGRARWLLPVGLVVALALAATAAAEQVDFDGSIGERSWRAVDGGSYRLGAGEATLDLRSLRGLDDVQVEARLGLGQLTVLVPEGMSVAIDAEIGEGVIGGSAAPFGETDDEGRHEFVVGSADDVTVTLDLEVGVGEIEVRRAVAS